MTYQFQCTNPDCLEHQTVRDFTKDVAPLCLECYKPQSPVVVLTAAQKWNRPTQAKTINVEPSGDIIYASKPTGNLGYSHK